METKISAITLANVKNYLNVTHNLDDELLTSMMESAKAFVCSLTFRTIEELDLKPEAVTAYLRTVANFYDDRSTDGDNLRNNNTYMLTIRSLRKKGML